MTFLPKSGAGYSGDHTDSVVPLVADLALNNPEALACGIDRSRGLASVRNGTPVQNKVMSSRTIPSNRPPLLT